MHTVLIVDDEPLVQVGLQSMIDWKARGVALLPCASNGQAALEAIRNHHPDLVLTDIKMPLMDGLELIRQCRQEMNPGPEFVVLTSFEDFSYAREAVKHRVSDYLVKLELTPEILSQAVARALGKTRAALTDTGPRPPRTGGAAPVEQFAAALVEGRFATEGEAAAALAETGASWEGLGLAVVECRLEGDLDTVVPAAKMAWEILAREYGVHPLPSAGTNFSALLTHSGGQNPETVEERMAESVAACLKMVHRYFNATLTAGLGRVTAHLLSAAASGDEARAALAACGPGRSVTAWTNLGSAPPAPFTGEEFGRGLEQALTGLDAGALADLFRRARTCIGARDRLAEALDLGTAALYSVLSGLRDGETFLAEVFSGVEGGAKSLYAVPSTEHVAGWLSALEGGLKAHLEDQGSRHQEKLVDAMRRYVEVHHRERLQLKSVSEHFRLSPNYAGTLFRRFSGQGFSEFVAETKVAKAREMLASGRYKIYEIAEQLGFENSYYFSKVFRRVTGQSPREFLPPGTSGGE